MTARLAARLPAETITETLTGLLNDTKTLLLLAATVVVVWIIVKALWASGGALGATVAALLAGSFMLWAVNNLDFLQDLFDDQFTGASAISRQVDGPPPWAAELS
jgi:hypothetical protein